MTYEAIQGIGAYAPAFYITSETFAGALDRHEASGIEQCAIPDADEDPLTMAWEAGDRALEAAGVDPAAVSYLGFATTTPPVGEEDLSIRLGSMLGVSEDARHSYSTGSDRVGIQSVLDAADHASSLEGVSLVVVADAPAASPTSAIGQSAGGGAVGFVLGEDGPGSITDVAHGSTVAPGERYRPPESTEPTGLGITSYDRQAYRSAVSDAVGQLAIDLPSVDAAAVHAFDGKEPYRLSGPLDLENETIHQGTRVHDLGYTGAATVPIGIAHAVAGGAGSILAVGYGAGAGADALHLELGSVPLTADLDPTVELDYAGYLRRRGELASTEPEGGGAYVSLPSWVRTLPQRHRLEAGRCVACGELSLPPEGFCSSCGETERYEQVTLSGTGTVEAITTISSGGAPPEFEVYQSQVGAYQTAVIAFDGPDGTAVSLPAMVATEAAVDVGDRVRRVIRRIYTQEDLPRYGIKVMTETAQDDI